MSTEFFNDQWRIPSNENQNKISNYSMDFDGTNDSINVGQSLNIYSSQSRTISCWFNINSFATTPAGDGSNLLGYGTGSTLQAFSLAVTKYVNNPNHRLYLHVWDNTYDISGTTQILENNWYLATVTYDGSTLKLYLNGNLEGSSSTSSLNTTTSDFIIGQGLQQHWNTLNGKIDQVTVFDYALSQDQVTQLGAEGYAFNFPNRAHPAAQTIFLNNQAQVFNNATNFSFSGWFKMDNNENQSIFDLKDGSNRRFNINYHTTSQGLRCNFDTSGGGSYASLNNAISSGKITFGKWFHYAGVLDGSGATNSDRVKLYINGQPVSLFYGGTQATSLGAIGATNKIEIGQSINSTFRGFRGDAGNVQMWDASLSPSEVTTLYNNGKPLYTGTQPQASNMQFWYKLDNSELFNGAEWSIDNSKYPSVYKSSLNFSGNNQYLQVPDSNDFSFGNGATDSPFSVSAWVNPDVVESAGIVAKYVTSGWEWLVYFTDSNKLRLQLQNNNSTGNTINLTTDAAIPINTWTHVSATYNANSESNGIDLYINGSLQSLVTEGGSGTYQAMTNTTAPLQIGTWSGSFRPINGQISNVSIWDAELTQAQVSEIYNNGTPSNLSSHSATSNLISWWELDNTTTGLQDSKGSNNASNIGTTEYIGFVNTLAGESDGMNASSLVASNISGELITNPMITSPKPIAYYQLGDQSVSTGPTSDYLVPNNSLSDYVFNIDSSNVNYIDLGTNPFSFTENLTVSLWVKSTQTATNTFIGKDVNVSGGRNWMVMLYQNKVYFWTTSTGNLSNLKDIQSNVAGVVSDGKWHHIVCVNNQTNVTKQIYIDGVLDVTNSNGGLISTSSSPVQIGKRPSGSPYDGEMSNVALWDTALTGPQVETIYNNGAPNDISSLSPVAWYKLDAGEIFNSTSTKWSVDNNSYPSVYQSSLNFNGTSDYLDCGNITNLNSQSAFSTSAWINYSGTPGSLTHVIASGGSSTTTNRWWIQLISSTQIRYGMGGGVGSWDDITVPSISSGSWNHIVSVQDGTSLDIYLNGIKQNSSPITVRAVNTNIGNDFTIGKYFDGGYEWSGKLSNIALWNTELTATQVETLYNNGTPEASISHSPVSWWKLDNTTTGLIDNGSASNNGTNNGATEYAGFVNELAGKSFNMNSANLVTSDLQQTSGYSPYALDFDGIDDYLDCGNDSSLQITGAMTISYWVKGTSTLGASGVGTLDSATTSVGYLLGPTTTNTISFGVALTSSSLLFVPTTQQITTTEWHHIVGVYTPSVSMKIYIDGQLSKTETSNIPSSQYASGSNFRIGYRTCCQIDGQISNVAIWNTDLSSSEINEIYNEGVPSNLNNFSGTAPVSWWQIGSNSSYNSGAWTCLDEIGSNNAVSSGSMTNDDIVDGPGYSASGLGTSSIDIKGDAPYSTANGLSENMDVLDRTTDVPS